MHPHAAAHARRPRLRGANDGPDGVGAFVPAVPEQQQHRMLPVVGKCDHEYCSAIFLGVLVVPLACLCLCAYFCERLRDGWLQQTGGKRTNCEHNAIAGLTGGDDAFREQLRRSRERHQSEFDEIISIDGCEGEAPPDAPSSGIYKAKYMDYKMQLRDAKVRLVFSREDGRYKIGGASEYESGETNVIEGYVLPDGREGWWREDFHSGAVGTELVNYGTFDFKRNCFVGKWRSSVGHSGSFIKFYS